MGRYWEKRFQLSECRGVAFFTQGLHLLRILAPNGRDLETFDLLCRPQVCSTDVAATQKSGMNGHFDSLFIFWGNDSETGFQFPGSELQRTQLKVYRHISSPTTRQRLRTWTVRYRVVRRDCPGRRHSGACCRLPARLRVELPLFRPPTRREIIIFPFILSVPA